MILSSECKEQNLWFLSLKKETKVLEKRKYKLKANITVRVGSRTQDLNHWFSGARVVIAHRSKIKC